MSSNRKLANDMIPGSATHPGTIIREELDTRNMRHIQLAEQLGIAKNVMSELVNAKRNITADLALKLETALDIKAEFWMGYQVAYDLDKIRLRNLRLVDNQTRSISKKQNTLQD